MSVIQDLTRDWSGMLQLAVDSYIRRHGMDQQKLLRTDLVLILLRLDTTAHPEASQRVAELTGRGITMCPSAMPPWPPKPVAARPRAPVVEQLTQPNPCSPTTAMFYRYEIVKKGMTREQLLARGVTGRDLNYWKSHGYIKFTGGSNGTRQESAEAHG